MDSIALEYYRIIKFYEHHEPETHWTPKKPFQDEDIKQIVLDFYYVIYSDCKDSTPYIKELIGRQRDGARYLKKNLSLGLLSSESYVREMSKLLDDGKEIPTEIGRPGKIAALCGRINKRVTSKNDI